MYGQETDGWSREKRIAELEKLRKALLHRLDTIAAEIELLSVERKPYEWEYDDGSE